MWGFEPEDVVWAVSVAMRGKFFMISAFSAESLERARVRVEAVAGDYPIFDGAVRWLAGVTNLNIRHQILVTPTQLTAAHPLRLTVEMSLEHRLVEVPERGRTMTGAPFENVKVIERERGRYRYRSSLAPVANGRTTPATNGQRRR